MVNIEGIDIEWLGHDCFKLKKDGYVVYLDPFKLPENPEKADVILVTHEHFDHFSMEDILKIVKPRTYIVAANKCQVPLNKEENKFGVAIYMVPGEVTDAGEVNIRTVPAYNLNKFRSPGLAFHPREDQKLGYIFKFGGKTFYLMGDTDNILELKDIKDIDIAFVPVSGTYVMTPEEASQAVAVFKPKIAIPMHYGSVVGTKQDAEKFKSLVKTSRVEILG